jgi:hypothetical protein
MNEADDHSDPTARESLRRILTTDLNIPNNPVCREACDAPLKQPLLPFHVGIHYRDCAEKPLIVGKPHRPRCKELLISDCIDLGDGDAADLFYHPRRSHFWRYTQEIVRRVYRGDAEGWQQIAVTTLVKCPGAAQGQWADHTTRAMAESCISSLGVITSEIRYLKPRTIVFYTVKLFPDLLADLPIGEWRNITAPEHTVPCGGHALGWWERRCHTSWDENVRVLITEHPQGKPKEEYTGTIARWIIDKE